jgi:hypothetical protein
VGGWGWGWGAARDGKGLHHSRPAAAQVHTSDMHCSNGKGRSGPECRIQKALDPHSTSCSCYVRQHLVHVLISKKRLHFLAENPTCMRCRPAMLGSIQYFSASNDCNVQQKALPA